MAKHRITSPQIRRHPKRLPKRIRRALPCLPRSPLRKRWPFRQRGKINLGALTKFCKCQSHHLEDGDNSLGPRCLAKLPGESFSEFVNSCVYHALDLRPFLIGIKTERADEFAEQTLVGAGFSDQAPCIVKRGAIEHCRV